MAVNLPGTSAARRLVRRHRRALAAVLAATAVLVGLSSLRAPAPAAEPGPAAADPTAPRPDEVAVPVQLASPALAAALEAGDIIDLVTVTESGGEVAGRVRVLAVSSSSGGLTSTSSSVVLVAADPADAIDIAVSPEPGYSVVIHPRAGGGFSR